MPDSPAADPIRAEIEAQLENRILVLDGAMGTTIREYGLEEKDARGQDFANNKKDLLNNGDILSITKPEVIQDIHKRFYQAGSDIVETNTFSATTIAQSEFFVEDPRETGGRKDPQFFQEKVLENPFLQELAHNINYQSAQLAKQAALAAEESDGRKRWVAGAIGPMTVSLSVSPDANNPAFRVVTFDQVKNAYKEQVRSLIQGGTDILMVETIFDALNAKAALVAIQEVTEADNTPRPIIVSAAVGRGGETMISAQKAEALWNSVAHVNPLAIGLNCSLGPDLMQPFLEELSKAAWAPISCYPNAGLPNPLAPTGFDLEPQDMGNWMSQFGDHSLLNFAGGCCGNTPAHIAQIAASVKSLQPRPIPQLQA